MADSNKYRGSNRGSSQDWNENRGYYGRDYDEERGYSSGSYLGNRNYGNSANNRGWEDENRGPFSNSSGRYNREDEYRGSGYGSSQGRRYGSGSDYGYRGRSRENDYDPDNESRWGSSRSSNFGSSYNQGSFHDSDDYNQGRYGSSYGGRNYGNSNYGGGYDYDRNQQRSYGRENYNSRYGSNRGYQDENRERDWWDRTTDEVASWFGNDEAERRREQDRRREGYHRGKGPKGYKRSDERIKEDINDRLSDDPFVDASFIEATVTDGEVTLTGTVSDRSDKRRAEDIAEAISGVKNVENRIRVSSQEENKDFMNTRTGTSVTGTTAGTPAGKTKSTFSNS